MLLRQSRIGKLYYKVLERTVMPALKSRKVSPDMITLVGFLIAVLVPLGALIHPVWGLVFILLSGFADTLDGLASRAQNRTSSFGAFWDSSLDRAGDTFFLLGLWVLCWNFSRAEFLTATFLLFASVLLTLLISYTKARIEGLGGQCDRGIMERALRILFLAAWIFAICLFPERTPGIIWTGLAAYILLCLTTVIQRIFCARKELGPADGHEP